ncbi:hypothetical protein JT358_03895 [Micrococcales bacterium 31B]|nr:hypothetical protein [Micrococcales bacterium 31B]
MPQKTYEIPPMPPTNHGNTQAAWAMSGLGMLGSTIAGVGMILSMSVMMWVGVAIFVLGAVVSLGMKKAGKGQIHNTEPADLEAIRAQLEAPAAAH